MSLEKRLKVIEHYKKFFGIKEITEEHQLDIDWAEHLIEQEFVVENLNLFGVSGSLSLDELKQISEIVSDTHDEGALRMGYQSNKLSKLSAKLEEIIRLPDNNR